MKLKVSEIIRLASVFGRYREYPDKVLGIYISDGLRAIEGIMKEVDHIGGKYDRIGTDIQSLQERHSKVEGDRRVFVPYDEYESDIVKIREFHGWSAEQESKDRKKFEKLLSQERDVEIGMISFDALPDTMNSIDIEMLKPVMGEVNEL